MWVPAHSCPLVDRQIWAIICTLRVDTPGPALRAQGKPLSESGMDGVGK